MSLQLQFTKANVSKNAPSSHPIPGAPRRPDAVLRVEDAIAAQLQNNEAFMFDIF